MDKVPRPTITEAMTSLKVLVFCSLFFVLVFLFPCAARLGYLFCVCVFVCLSVCLCVFCTIGNKADGEQYQWLQCYKHSKSKWGFS